jgi:hypothetical protein
MPSVSDKEILVKIQVNTMVDYLVNTYKYTYDEAFSLVVGSNTYHRLLTSTLYLNQDPLYVLDDFKSEVMPRIS